MTRTVQPLDPDSWDFAQCPEDELRLCLYYEGAREVSVVKQYIDSETYRQSKITVPSLGSKYIAFTCAEFPVMPWLGIDKATRRMHLKEAELADGTWRYAEDRLVVPNYAVGKFVRLLSEDVITSTLFDPAGGPVPDIGVRSMPEIHATLVALQLDWSKSKHALTKDFQKLLNSLPTKFENKSSNRGKYRARLNGLAAKRLQDYCKQHGLPKACDAAFEMWKRQSQSECPYSDSRAGRRAIRKTRKFLENLYALKTDERTLLEGAERGNVLSVRDI